MIKNKMIMITIKMISKWKAWSRRVLFKGCQSKRWGNQAIIFVPTLHYINDQLILLKSKQTKDNLLLE